MSQLTIANQLTILRIVLVPLFVVLMLYDKLGAALTVFVIAGVTDALDGLRQAASRGSWGVRSAARRELAHVRAS